MKSRMTLLIFLTTTIIVSASFIIPYDKAKPPTLSLPAAYERAIVTLGPATNQFHCINATVTTFSSPAGEWLFTFYSTNSRPKFVTVEFNGKTHVQDIIAH